VSRDARDGGEGLCAKLHFQRGVLLLRASPTDGGAGKIQLEPDANV
jgi:hypothetical protein